MRVHAPDKCPSQHLQRIVDTTERPPPGAVRLGLELERLRRRLASAVGPLLAPLGIGRLGISRSA